MSEQDTVNEADKDQTSNTVDTKPEQPTRQRSTIGFPYMPMHDAEALAGAIHSNAGHGDCSIHQMAAWTSQSPKSSTFRVQIAAARMFGLIESDGTEAYRLTILGRRLLDPATARSARAEAFLNVPLFSAVFEKYKDGALPPAAALEREIALLGVAEKQKSKARHVFEKSATSAAFFEHGKTKLVMPAVAKAAEEPPPPGRINGGGGGGDGESIDLDPLLMALLRKIPPVYEDWPAEKRVRWFKTFAMNVSQVYDEDENPVELNIELKNEHIEKD